MIERVGVIGAGTMGAGIAQVCALAGMDVILCDISPAALERGIQGISASLRREVDKGRLDAAVAENAQGRIVGGDNQALAQVGLVIESATELLSLKRQILSDVERLVGPSAILATNTSSISITRLASAVSRPEGFIGLHFFNPAPAMALVEVIAGLQTSGATLATATDFVRSVGKRPIVVSDSPGFVVNRLVCPMINEAIVALQEGVTTAEDIDAALTLGCHHPVGPLALADLIGLDVLLAIMDTFFDSFKDSKYRAAPLLRLMVNAGRLGRKSGRGFYNYARSATT